MFKNEFQGGPYFDVFSAQGKTATKCKLSANSKVFDKEVRSFVYNIEGSGNTIKFQIPENSKHSAGLQQSFLVLQVNIPKAKEFNIELVITDSSQTRRRIQMSTVGKDMRINPLHIKIPIAFVKRDKWINLCIDLEGLVKNVWSTYVFNTLDVISLMPTCKLRRIYTTRCQLGDTTDDPETMGIEDLNESCKLSTIPRCCKLSDELDQAVQVVNIMKVNAFLGIKTKDATTSKDSAPKESDSDYHIAFGSKIKKKPKAKSLDEKEEKPLYLPHPPRTPSGDVKRRRRRVRVAEDGTRNDCSTSEDSRVSSAGSSSHYSSCADHSGQGDGIMPSRSSSFSSTGNSTTTTNTTTTLPNVTRASIHYNHTQAHATSPSSLPHTTPSLPHLPSAQPIANKRSSVLNYDSDNSDQSLYHTPTIELKDTDISGIIERLALHKSLCDDDDTLTQSTLRNTISDTLRDVDDIDDSVDTTKSSKPKESVMYSYCSQPRVVAGKGEPHSRRHNQPKAEGDSNRVSFHDNNCSITGASAMHHRKPTTSYNRKEPQRRSRNSIREINKSKIDQNYGREYNREKYADQDFSSVVLADNIKLLKQQQQQQLAKSNHVQRNHRKHLVNENTASRCGIARDPTADVALSRGLSRSPSSDEDGDPGDAESYRRQLSTVQDSLDFDGSPDKHCVDDNGENRVTTDKDLESQVDLHQGESLDFSTTDSFEARMLESLRRQALEGSDSDSNSDEECQGSRHLASKQCQHQRTRRHRRQNSNSSQYDGTPPSPPPSLIYQDTMADEDNTNNDTMSPRRNLQHQHSYQEEMKCMTNEYLSVSNPRNWANHFSPPINETQQKNNVSFKNEYIDDDNSSSDNELDLLYDPVLNCYYDPKTCKYYELL